MKSFIQKDKYEYLNYIKENFETKVVDSNNMEILVASDIVRLKGLDSFEIVGFNNYDHKRIFNLNNEENWSVLILLLSLLKMGYKKRDIYLEKTWKLGHNNKGSLDIAIYDGKKPFHFIEVKSHHEISKYVEINESKNDKYKQLLTYAWQEKSVKFISYYTFDINSEMNKFFTIPSADFLMKDSYSLDGFSDNWNKLWDESNIILCNPPFNSKIVPVAYEALIDPSKVETAKIIKQFLVILRVNSVSDKSNAFDKMINLFISKVYDERNGNSTFWANKNKISGLKFQFLEKKDDYVSLLKRLNDLYKNGMKTLLDKDVIDYSDSEIERLIGTKNNPAIREAFDNIRLKKNSAFSFIEVFDDETFNANAKIVEQIVSLLQKFRFTNENKSQFLGDFFEELLNTSWKQEAGQFFTPMPIVDMIINSLPIKKKIVENIKNQNENFLPKAIDYACGSGHFIISYMQKINDILLKTNFDKYNPTKIISKKLEKYRDDKYCWAGEVVFGIEKDYRLIKTTKIATYLNGDGNANIIYGDGIAKFSSDYYAKTPLYTTKKTNPIFDFVIANPPYAVEGFEKNILSQGLNELDFTLIRNIPSGSIEILFVERSIQLLKEGGIGAIILPKSILSVKKYSRMRDYLRKNVRIISFIELGELSFGGTSTSPVIVIFEKVKPQKNYELAVIRSPRYKMKDAKAEKKWLGYEFSSNKHKLGITINNNNLSETIASKLRDFSINNKTDYTDDDVEIKNISDITLNNNMIYPGHVATKGIPLVELINIFCPTDELDKDVEYIEIANINRNGKISGPFKKKKSKKTCMKGDILFPKLVTTPDKFKIAISDKSYELSSAIAVLRINDNNIRDKVYNYFKNNENGIITNMFMLGDGFKATYLKISDENLLHNIKLKI